MFKKKTDTQDTILHTAASPKPNVAYSQIPRNLTPKELSESGTVKMILADNDRLLQENAKLKNVEDKFHSEHEQVIIYQEKLKTSDAFEIISTVLVAAGSLIVGSALEFNPLKVINTGWIAMGILLFLGGIIAKVIKR